MPPPSSAPSGEVSVRERRRSRPLSRRVWAWVLLLVLLPATVALAVKAPLGTGLTSALLVLLLEAVVIAAVGGFVVAVVAAVTAVLLANWFLVPPYRTLVVQSTDDVVALVVFVAVAVAASALVETVARARSRAGAAGAEAELLRDTVGTPVDEADPVAALDRIRVAFGMDEVVLLDASGEQVAGSGRQTDEPTSIDVRLADGQRVIGRGPAIIGADREVLMSLATAAVRAAESRALAAQASRASELAAADRAKAALLAGVGHDLRTPIAAIRLAADALAQNDIEWSAADRAELVDGIASSAVRLDDLVSNLLDMSRIEAGALAVTLVPAALDGVAASALIGLAGPTVDIDLPDDLPLALCDPVLLERVLANLLSNAQRFSPADAAVTVTGRADGDHVLVSVVDHGPGVDDDHRALMFDAFQRLGDRSPGGTGVGLAVARTFTEAMGGSLVPSATPGGGLTMTVELQAAAT